MRLLPTLLILSGFLLTACNSSKRIAPDYSKTISQHRIDYKEKSDQDEHFPLKGNALDSMSFYPADQGYAVNAIFTKTKEPEAIVIKTYAGKKQDYFIYGTIDFSLNGKEQRLNIYRSLKAMKMPQYKNYLFLPFKDYTNDEETYGGGRYIDLETTDIKSGQVVIDFNKAYNPYCAYSAGYNCPIPPIANHIEMAIPAGERKYTGSYIGAH